MFRSITRKINLPILLQTKACSNALRSKTFLHPHPSKYYKSSIAQHGFHTFRPLYEQEQQVDPNHKMLIGFTCKVCEDRSHHVMSKHSYTKGVVLIQCPGCKNRHLIADNLGWFRDSKVNIEDLVKEKGEAIRHVIVDDQGVERIGDLMEWLPDIAHEEKIKKEKATKKASELKESQKVE